MRAPRGWWHDKPDGLARLLQPFGAIYGAITAARMKGEGMRAPVPVICIGNFVAGGAGKTPTALALGEMLIAQGKRIAFLSRGFGGSLSHARALRVDLAKHNSAQVGDEPLLLAKLAPTFICTDRVAGAQAAADAGASLIIMDDGLQNPSLHKDLRLAVVDGAMGVGNGLCLPAGPLRAPLADQWPHVDALIVIGEGKAGDRLAADAQALGCPVLRAKLVPQNRDQLRGQRVFAFAGIGAPQKFFRTLEACGAELIKTQSFEDHHPFTPAEIQEIRRACEADAAGPLIPVTTEKDAMRIASESVPGLIVLKVALKFESSSDLAAVIASKITRG